MSPPQPGHHSPWAWPASGPPGRPPHVRCWQPACRWSGSLFSSPRRCSSPSPPWTCSGVGETPGGYHEGSWNHFQPELRNGRRELPLAVLLSLPSWGTGMNSILLGIPLPIGVIPRGKSYKKGKSIPSLVRRLIKSWPLSGFLRPDSIRLIQ